MFAYRDPTGSPTLQAHNALDTYRQAVHEQYRHFARLPQSHFTLLDAFDGIGTELVNVATVTWIAFPRLAGESFAEIDDNRFRLQDEYVEWHTEEGADSLVAQIVFTTEFAEYYEALAAQGLDALIAGIRDVIPTANPTVRELFGADFDPTAASPDARVEQFRFRNRIRRIPWNNGTKGTLYLGHASNTLGALFGLVGECAIVRPGLESGAVCGNLGNACVPGRNSDPAICAAVQNLARTGNGLTLSDPVGVRILRLEGIWKLGGQAFDINDPAANRGTWTVSRNGRRGVLNVAEGLTIGDAPITNGTQVSAKLRVGASVLSVPESLLPPWARTGQESSRMIT